jgi:hypothetical protein
MVTPAVPAILIRCEIQQNIKTKMANMYSISVAIIADAEFAAEGSISAVQDVKHKTNITANKHFTVDL